MPGSELYRNDSDAESDYDSDALSPADGYFSPTQRPRQMFTTPSSSGASDSKADEDARERTQATATPPSSHGHVDDDDDNDAGDVSRGPATTSPTSDVDSDPLLDRYGPPPAYSAAISTPYMPQARRETDPISEQTPPAAYGAVDLERGPQSMTDASGPSPPSVSENDSLLYASPKHQGRFWTRRGMMKALLAIFAVVVFVAVALKMTYSSGSNGDPKVAPAPKTPTDPHTPGSSPGTAPDTNWPSWCPSPTKAQTAVRNLDTVSDLWIRETVRGNSGGIRVVEGSKSQDEDVKVTVSMAASSPYEVSSIRFLGDRDGALLIDNPDLQEGSYRSWWRSELIQHRAPCIWSDITISLRPGLQLEQFQLDTTSLDIELEELPTARVENMNVDCKGSSDLRTPSSSFRRTKISLGTGDIKGKFDLRDSLSLKTRTGDIDVDVIPREADGGGNQPAAFICSSYSGDVKVRYDTKDPPKRDYQAGIETHSSKIEAKLLHGSRTQISGNTGTMRLNLTPAYEGSEPSTLDTQSNTGDMKVIVDEGVYDTFPVIKSSHKCTTGNIDLVYPQAWEGIVTGSILTGTVKFRGKDLHFTQRTPFEVEGRKGHGDSNILFDTHTGAVDILIGEE